MLKNAREREYGFNFFLLAGTRRERTDGFSKNFDSEFMHACICKEHRTC